MKEYNVCIVGATGLVGRMFISVLEEYHFPIKELRLLASSKSAGKKLMFNGAEYVVEELTESSFNNMDIALFSAGGDVSKKFAPIAAKNHCIVIDNSSAWRQDDNVPLVVPEVNKEDLRWNKGIIANPNCSTIQSVVPLKALYDIFGIKRINYTTYQAVSGSGIKGITDLENTRKGLPNAFYPYNISKTCIPEIDIPLDNGYTKEEMKMVWETRKMFHDNDIRISATCVRVPIERSHAVSIAVELARPFTIDEVYEALRNMESVVILDDLKNHIYPVATKSTGNDLVYVGRIRRDLSCDNGLLLYCVADNTRRGAASNACLIAKKLIEMEVI